jgi:hypothetical protein
MVTETITDFLTWNTNTLVELPHLCKHCAYWVQWWSGDTTYGNCEGVTEKDVLGDSLYANENFGCIRWEPLTAQSGGKADGRS